MALNWYQCKRCGIAVEKTNEPSNSGCPNREFHHWVKLGEVGDKNYNCKYCGTLVKTKNEPSNSGCTIKEFHHWNKL
jgi:hypothetical protein